MHASRLVPAILCASVVTGCAFGPKPPPMMPDMPIEIDTSFGSPRYKQGGHAIDAASMRDELRKNPEASSSVNGAVAMSWIGIILAAAGGAMVGVPLGQAGGGDPHPWWPLAGAGAGAAVSGIVIAALAPVVLDKAVKEHNKRFAAPAARPLAPLPGVTPVAGATLPGPRREVQALLLP